MKQIKTILVDDHELFRDGVDILLELSDHIELVASLPDAMGLLRYLKTHELPDVFILDINLPGISGLVLAEQLTDQYGPLNIVFMTSNSARVYMDAALKSGAKGFLTKGCSKDELVTAIELVSHGQFYFGKDMEQPLYHGYVRNLHGVDKVSELTIREVEVLKGFANGLTYQEVADELALSKKTVEVYKKGIYKKLALKNQTDLIRYAIRHHIIDP